MTRFWITLQQGVNFVLKSFERMQGGEIFIPKIPSVRIVDLATSMAPDLKQTIIGIRPGEKLNEIMCPADDYHLTVEFEDHYTIMPTINFHSKNFDYFKNHKGEKGTKVNLGFEYNSGNNHHFLTVDQLIELNKNIFNDL